VTSDVTSGWITELCMETEQLELTEQSLTVETVHELLMLLLVLLLALELELDWSSFSLPSSFFPSPLSVVGGQVLIIMRLMHFGK